MNKNLLIVVLVLTIFVGGRFFVANQNLQQSSNEQATQKESVQKNENITEKSSTSYVPYSKEVLEQSADKRRVLYFYASWCPTCKSANEDFTANPNKIPKDVIVIRTNYNDPDTDQEEKDLAKKYAVTYQHTFVQIDGQGNEVTKWNGGQTAELLANIK